MRSQSLALMLDGPSRQDRARHDLAHLLSCILLATDTLESDLEHLDNDALTPAMRELVGQMRGSGAILTHAGRMAVHVLADLDDTCHRTSPSSVIPLASAITRATQAVRPLLWSDVELTVSVDPELKVFGSGDDLATVLFNLMLNAAEALRRGGMGLGWIALRAHSLNGQVVLDVSDSGPGLPKTGPIYGTGLAICRRLMREMGGGMEFLPAHGGGALARLRLQSAPPIL